MISFLWHFGKGKTIGIKNRLVVTRDSVWKETDWERGAREFFEKMKMAYIMNGVQLHNSIQLPKCIKPGILERLNLIVTKL